MKCCAIMNDNDSSGNLAISVSQFFAGAPQKLLDSSSADQASTAISIAQAENNKDAAKSIVS